MKKLHKLGEKLTFWYKQSSFESKLSIFSKNIQSPPNHWIPRLLLFTGISVETPHHWSQKNKNSKNRSGGFSLFKRPSVFHHFIIILLEPHQPCKRSQNLICGPPLGQEKTVFFFFWIFYFLGPKWPKNTKIGYFQSCKCSQCQSFWVRGLKFYI